MSELSRLLTPPDLVEAANAASLNLLPDKSRNMYLAVYNKFIEWQKTKNTTSFSENVLMAYFSELSKTYKSSSLWSRYSMLRSTIINNHNIDLKTYGKLTALLKKSSVGFQSKKSKVLTADEVEKYLNEAPDEIHLATKVALIFGITGACRREELSNIKLVDVQEVKSMFVVRIPTTKTHIPRTFTITDKFYSIVKKYTSHRPSPCKCDRFFLNFANGRCTQQPIGVNKFGNMPKLIATYLELKNPEQYTGHSFRRTSATLLSDAGADISTLKRHGGWQSSKVAEGYIEQSLNNKQKICNLIGQSISLKGTNESLSISNEETPQLDFHTKEDTPTKKPKKNENSISMSQNVSNIGEHTIDLSSNIQYPNKNNQFTFNNCHNVSFHFHEK